MIDREGQTTREIAEFNHVPTIAILGRVIGHTRQIDRFRNRIGSAQPEKVSHVSPPDVPTLFVVHFGNREGGDEGKLIFDGRDLG